VDNAAESAAIAADSSRVSTMSGGFDRFPDSEARVYDHRFGTGGGASRRRVNAGRELRISAGQYVLCLSVTPDSPRSFAEGREGWLRSAARAAEAHDFPFPSPRRQRCWLARRAVLRRDKHCLAGQRAQMAVTRQMPLEHRRRPFSFLGHGIRLDHMMLTSGEAPL
jgi:hypothetical protein